MLKRLQYHAKQIGTGILISGLGIGAYFGFSSAFGSKSSKSKSDSKIEEINENSLISLKNENQHPLTTQRIEEALSKSTTQSFDFVGKLEELTETESKQISKLNKNNRDLDNLDNLQLNYRSKSKRAYPITSEFRVNTYTFSIQTQPAIAALNGGGFIVVWESFGQDGHGYGIYGQQYNATGDPIGSEFQVNTYTVDDQEHPAITDLTDGGFVVVWESWQGNLYNVYGQQYNATSNSIGSEFQVNTYTEGWQQYPANAGLTDGGFVVVWESKGQDGDLYGVYGQQYNATGNSIGSEFQVNTFTTCDQLYPAIAGLTDGGFVVVWQSYGQIGSGNEVYGQRYNSIGNPVGTEFQVNTYTTNDQNYPVIAGLTNGRFVVVWESEGQDGDLYGVYGQQYNATGNAIGSEFQVNTYTFSRQGRPATAVLNDGGFVIVWESNILDGNGYGTYGQQYNAAGNTEGGNFQVNTYTTSHQTGPAVVSLKNNRFVVVWHSDGQDGNSYGIYGRIFSSDSIPTTTTQVPTTTQTTTTTQVLTTTTQAQTTTTQKQTTTSTTPTTTTQTPTITTTPVPTTTQVSATTSIPTTTQPSSTTQTTTTQTQSTSVPPTTTQKQTTTTTPAQTSTLTTSTITPESTTTTKSPTKTTTQVPTTSSTFATTSAPTTQSQTTTTQMQATTSTTPAKTTVTNSTPVATTIPANDKKDNAVLIACSIAGVIAAIGICSSISFLVVRKYRRKVRDLEKEINVKSDNIPRNIIANKQPQSESSNDETEFEPIAGKEHSENEDEPSQSYDSEEDKKFSEFLDKIEESKMSEQYKLKKAGIKWCEITLGKLLGQGSFGQVNQAIWQGSKVAVKQLKTYYDNRSLKDFKNEMQLMASLKYPYIVTFYGMGKCPNGNMFIVMEYMPGGSLYYYLHEYALKLMETKPDDVKNIAVTEKTVYIYKEGSNWKYTIAYAGNIEKTTGTFTAENATKAITNVWQYREWINGKYKPNSSEEKSRLKDLKDRLKTCLKTDISYDEHIHLHANQQLTWKNVLKIAKGIGKGLCFLHNHKIVHRDLRSPNILLTKHLRAKIADFGLTRFLTAKGTAKTKGQGFGQHWWKAPELFKEDTAYTKKSDIYSYGLVLWELISRRKPLQNISDPCVVMQKRLKGEIEEIPENCNIKYADLLKSCWANEPAHRPLIKQAIKVLKEIQQEEKSVISNFT